MFKSTHASQTQVVRALLMAVVGGYMPCLRLVLGLGLLLGIALCRLTLLYIFSFGLPPSAILDAWLHLHVCMNNQRFTNSWRC
jgi:hypothetical protein